MLKEQRRGDDQSPPSSAEVKNGWSHTSAPPTFLHGVGRENLTFLLYVRNGFVKVWL